MKQFVAVLILALFASFVYGRNGDAAGRALLRKQLFSDYDKVNIPDNVEVGFGVTLLTFNIDEDKGTLEADAWFKYTWADSRLQWDNETIPIDVMRISPNEIWKPDITLYNSANLKDMVRCWDSNPIVYSTGTIIWVPPCQLSTHCNFTLDKYPYAEQKCMLKFGSWTYDAELLNLKLYEGEKSMNLDYFGNTEWKVTENVAARNEKFYPCCKEPYTDLTFNITVQRIDTALEQCSQ